MKTFINILICLLSFELIIFAQAQTSVHAMDPEFAEVLTNPPPPGFATRLDYVRSFTNKKDILNAYHKRLLNDGEAMIALEALGDKNSMDIYGQVVDQNNQPVAGADVLGNLEISGDFFPHHAKTDAQGKFSFEQLHGANLFISFQRQGYDYNQRLLPERPKNYLPDPNNPLVFTMWKEHGAEPMRHSKIHSYIPCDGSTTCFDLVTGKQDADGNFTVSITRKPVNIDRRTPFNWSVTFQVANGGLQKITNSYPNEAPAEGYQTEISYSFPTSMTNWTPRFTPSFYFKSDEGHVFGRMTVNIMADFQPPPTLFDSDIFANPAGSRNLEFDPKKQIY